MNSEPTSDLSRMESDQSNREKPPLPLLNYSLSSVCPACETPVYRYACKVRCPRCGFVWDCSEL